jgi:hypothetical protein
LLLDFKDSIKNILAAMPGNVARYNLRSGSVDGARKATESDADEPKVGEKEGTYGNIRAACVMQGVRRCPDPFDLQNLAVGLNPLFWPIFWDERNLNAADMDCPLGRAGDGGDLRERYIKDVTKGLLHELRTKGGPSETLSHDVVKRVEYLASLHVQLARHWVKLDPDTWSIATFMAEFAELRDMAKDEAREIVSTLIRKVKGKKAEDVYRSALAIDSDGLPAFLTAGVDAAVKAKKTRDELDDSASDRSAPKKRRKMKSDGGDSTVEFDADKHFRKKSRSGVYWIFDKTTKSRLGRERK